MVDYAFVGDLDDKGITDALKRIDAKMVTLGNRMNGLFEPLSKAKSSFAGIEKAGKSAISAIRTETDLLKQDLKSIGTELQDTGKPKISRATKREKSIFSQEIQRLPQTTESRDLVQVATIKSKTPDELEALISLSDQFSEAQISSARAVAKTRLEIEQTAAAFIKADDEGDEFLETIEQLQHSLAQGASNESIAKTKEALKTAGTEAFRLRSIMQSFDEVDDDIEGVTTEIIKLSKSLDDAGTDTKKIDQIKKDADEQLKVLKKVVSEKKKLAADELKLQARIEKAQIRSQKVAERTLKAQIKAIPEVKNQLAGLADKYNGLIVPMGKVTEEMSDQQKEVRDLINSDERLKKVVDDLTDKTGEFNLELKRTDFKKPSGGITQMGSALSGLVKGGAFLLVLNGLREIGRVALRMAEDVVRSLYKVTIDSAKIADQFQGQIIAFGNILPDSFDDAEAAAERLFNTTKQISVNLGVDASGIVSAVLPFVEEIGQLEPMAKRISELLSLSELGGDPKEQASAIRATIDALVEGNARSIRQMFEITGPEGLDEVIAFAKEGNIFEALEALGDITAGRGVEFESFADQTTRQVGILRENIRLLQGSYGDAINQNFSSFLQEINKFLSENSVGIEKIVRRLGEFVTEIGNLVGSELEEFVKNIDLDDVDQSLGEFINTLKTSKDTFDWLLDFLKDLNEFKGLIDDIFNAPSMLGTTAAEKQIGVFDKLNILIGNMIHGTDTMSIATNSLNNQLDEMGDKKLLDTTIAKRALTHLFTLFKAGLTSMLAQLGVVSDAVSNIFSDGFDADDFLDEFILAGETARDESLRDSINLLDSIDGRKVVAEIEINTTTSTQEDLDKFALDKILENIKKTNDTMVEAQKLIDTELYDVQREHNQAELELQKDHADQQIKLQLDLHREIAKMKRKYLDDLEKLASDGDENIEDLTLKHSRKLEDIENKRSNDELKAAIDTAKKKSEIEEAYLRKLAEMRRQFLFSANEAIRQNDAVAFLQLKRKFEFDQNEARIAKEQKDKDADNAADDSIQKIKDSAEDAKRAEGLANQRSEEDLKTSQDRKLAALQDSWKIQKREFRIKEDERREDLAKSQSDDIEALIAHGIAQRDAVKQTMDDEFTIISDGHDSILTMEGQKYELEQQLARNHVEKMFGIFGKLTQLSEGSLSNHLSNDSEESSIASPSASTGRGSASRMQGMRDGAIRVANDRGVLDEYISRITTLFEANDSKKLQQLITELNKLPHREFGGPVKKGQPYLTGEAGVELFIPQQNGTIIPNNFASMLNKQSASTQATFPSFSGGGGNIDNSKTYNSEFSMLDPSGFTSGQIMIMTEVVRSVILEATLNV